MSGKKPARSPAAEYRRRLSLVRNAQSNLDRAIAKGAPTKIASCRRAFADARRGAAKAKSQLGNTAGRRVRTRSARMDPAPTRGIPDIDSGVRYSQDPDADTRTVWVFRTGTSFHRLDCQIVEARDGAVQVPVTVAQKRNLVRCMHCVPMVR